MALDRLKSRQSADQLEQSSLSPAAAYRRDLPIASLERIQVAFPSKESDGSVLEASSHLPVRGNKNTSKIILRLEIQKQAPLILISEYHFITVSVIRHNLWLSSMRNIVNALYFA